MKDYLRWLLCCAPFCGLTQQLQPLSDTEFPTIPGDYRSVNWVDYDNDGRPDVFISEGSKAGGNNLLFHNVGAGKFEWVQAGKLTSDRLPSVGASWADVDNDGDEDAFVTSWYDQPSVLYVNDGKGTFKSVVNLVPKVAGYAEACAWSDMNNDGLSDLFVTRSAGDGLNHLFLQEAAACIDLHLPEKHASRGVIWSDFDNDGDPDLLVTNERTQSCDYYLNDKGKLQAFYSSGLTDEPISTMSASALDVDNDGDQDVLLISEKGSPRLFLNDGKGNFSRSVNTVFDSLKGSFVGSSFADIDNDGDLDVYITAAFGKSPEEKNGLLLNNGNGTFERDTTMQQPQGWSYGCAFGDYDRDGFMDLAVANCSAGSFPNVLYHNSGNANHWLEISCEGQAGRSAVGTKVRVKTTVNGKSVWQLREISAQTGYCGQNMRTVHFGLGDATQCDSLIVEWSSGKKTLLENVKCDQFMTVVETQSDSQPTLPEKKKAVKRKKR